MSVREDILLALQALLAADSFFPPAEIDAAEPGSWREAATTLGLADGLADAAAVQDCGEPELTRDGGPDDVWEMRGEFMIAYAVRAAPAARKAQRARRDAAAARIAALIAADRTLGLDPSTYAEVGPPTRHDNAPIKASAPVSTLLVPINVDYIATSAAG